MSGNCLQSLNPSESMEIEMFSPPISNNLLNLPKLAEICKRVQANSNCIRNYTRETRCGAAGQWVQKWP